LSSSRFKVLDFASHGAPGQAGFGLPGSDAAKRLKILRLTLRISPFDLHLRAGSVGSRSAIASLTPPKRLKLSKNSTDDCVRSP